MKFVATLTTLDSIFVKSYKKVVKVHHFKFFISYNFRDHNGDLYAKTFVIFTTKIYKNYTN